jgi:nickel transport protein
MVADRGASLLEPGIAEERIFGRGPVFTLFAVFLFLVIDFDSSAGAHSVQLRAYTVGERCFVQGYFNESEPAAGARVEVFGGDGKAFLKGQTDAHGKFVFRTPGTTPLKVVLTTDLGHRAESTVGGHGHNPVSPPIAETDRPEPYTHDHLHAGGNDSDAAGEMVMVSRQELETLIRQLLDHAMEEKLMPLYDAMDRMEKRSGGKGSRIVSGIGYILGIFGLAMFFAGRKQR